MKSDQGRFVIKSANGGYLNVWGGGPALPDTKAHLIWQADRKKATVFTQRSRAYDWAAKAETIAVIVRLVRRAPAFVVVPAPGDICGGTKKCPGCRACS